MCPRLVSRRVVREQSSQSDRLVAKLLTNQLLASRSLVALVEKQIERLKNPLQPTRQFFACRDFKGNPGLADFLFCPGQSLGNGRVSGEKGAADFGHAETAERLQCQSDLCFRRNLRMAANEH